MSEHIKPCPFWGEHDVDVARTNPNACWVVCNECDARTTSAPTREEAIEMWNCRTEDDGQPAAITNDQDREGLVGRSRAIDGQVNPHE